MNSIASRFARSMLVASAILLSAVPGAIAGTAFSRIVSFGDSLNDFGNMVQFTGGAFPNAPTYTYGRQTNGPVWVEYLAGRLDMSALVSNYAVIGAMTRPAPGFPTGNVWSDTFSGLAGTDVTSQIHDYLADHNGVADPNALHILEGGANDLPRIANPADIVANLTGCFLLLQGAGAKNIMVVTLPDIGKTPRVILGERTGALPPGSAALYTAVCAQLNAALRATIASVTAAGVSVTFADMAGFVDTVVASPSAFGFSEVQLPYLLAGGGRDPATFLFWDDLHPTTRGHQLFAEAAITSLIGTYSPRQGNGNGSGVINALRGLVKAPGGG